MRSMSRGIAIASLLLLMVAGCGGTAGNDFDNAPDGSGNIDSGGVLTGTDDAGGGHADAATTGGADSGGGDLQKGGVDGGGVDGAAAAGSTDAGGADVGTAAPDGASNACGSVAACNAPATCDRSGATPKCVCPQGYQLSDAGGGGSCVDINECATPSLNNCDIHATCTNTAGSFTCACNAPAYAGDGGSCACAAGYGDGATGCTANNGTACQSGADCQNGQCVGGTCCASACNSPGACQTATGATCAGGSSCAYPNAADNTSCDDGDACTVSDVCSSGSCVGGGAASCDDGNICTTDTCVSPTGCVHDGTGIMTAGCMTANLCTSYRCDGDAAGTCDAVALVDCTGTSDQCNLGVCSTTTGTCGKQAANEGGSCSDNNACTVGETCTSGTCGGGGPLNCNDNNPCTDDSCDAVLGCKNQDNTASCDDGNACTVNDQCATGLCQGSPKDCSAENDACNVGVCSAGNCGKSPKADNTACDDGLACTATDVCTGGTCKGSGDSCGANASACAEGPPKVCTCNATYVSSGGQCVPSTNECNASPCVAGATCNDPSSAPNNVVCTCPTGFTGDGKTSGTGCTQIDNCVGNPCGAGLGTCVNGINTYTCNCNMGYVAVNGACVCDMNGTFASQYTLATSWSGVDLFEDGTNVTSESWSIRTQTYDSSGNLTIKTTLCGGTTIDLCGENDPIGDEAYAQYLPTTIYTLSSMPVGSLTITLTNPLPGQAYQEPQTATLLGISLTDPLGAWPAAAANVGAGTNQTNGAVWVDNDNDGFLGVTSYTVPPGGILHTTAPYPLADYGATSTACPRRSASLARLAYNYLPGIEGLTLERVKRVYTASRIISSLSGTITSCDSTGATLIEGTVGGPDNGEPEGYARVGGCVQVNGTGEINCSSTLANEYDGENQSQHVSSASFVMMRVASTVTCADVRAMTFP
jgi:YD repeat-containing protein